MHISNKKKPSQDLTRWDEFVHVVELINDVKTSLKKSHFLTCQELYMLELYINPLYKQIASAFKLEGHNE